MSKKNDKNGKGKSLADPSRLKPLDSDDKQMLRVVVETPKGSCARGLAERPDLNS
jgi:hypothetical protein